MSEIRRRDFLKSAVLGAGALGLGFGLADRARALAPAGWSPSVPVGQRNLVLVHLQGGYDALSMLRPTSGSAATKYVQIRPQLASQVGTIALPGVFGQGLHPALGVIATEFGAGDCAIIQKVGLPNSQLSHFEARRVMAKGRATNDNADSRGWIGRLADVHFSDPLEIAGMNIRDKSALVANDVRPITLREIASLQSYNFIGSVETDARRQALQQMVAQRFGESDALDFRGREAVERGAELAETLLSSTQSVNLGGNYGLAWQEPLARSLPDIARMIAAPNVPTRVFYTRSVDFDTHAFQEQTGINNKPTLSDRLGLVMQSLGAFIQDLKTLGKWNDTAIVVFTEFGRRNYQNETGGTDHGHGFHAFVLGGQVNGGLKGNTVTAADLDAAAPHSNENLPVEIDYRTVFRKVVSDWLQLDPAPVFDDWSPLPGEPSFTLF